MVSEQPTAPELFNSALEAFSHAELEDAVAYLRAGFFENLYIGPTLLEEEYEAQAIWYPGVGSEPRAAREYAHRYGPLWQEKMEGLRFLQEVWRDSLVRSEIRSYINLSKAILQNNDRAQQADLLRERDRFVDARRIRRTQAEIVDRLQAKDYKTPLARPEVALILLAARDTAATVEFYRHIFRVEPVRTSRLAGGYAEFELPGIHVGIHGHDRLAEGDPYRLGPPPESLGWGAIFVIRISEFDRYYANAVEAEIDIIDASLEDPARRFFLVRDPSGYLMEFTEEERPRGF